MLKVAIIDDEPIARAGITGYVEQVPFLELTGNYGNVLQALESNWKEIDLLFLDIEMPGMNGLELLKTIPSPPPTIIITAYPEYALEGFELNVVDYLLKPVDIHRFIKSANRAREYIHSFNTTENTTVWLKDAGILHQVAVNDISYVNSMQNYLQVHLPEKTYTILSTLKEFKKSLPDHFIQTHKSYIVNKLKIERIEGLTIYLPCGRASISRNVKQQILELLTK